VGGISVGFSVVGYAVGGWLGCLDGYSVGSAVGYAVGE